MKKDAFYKKATKTPLLRKEKKIGQNKSSKKMPTKPMNLY